MVANNEKSTVYLRSTKDGNLDDIVADLMETCGWKDRVKEGATVVIKPNLCSPVRGKVVGSNTHVGLTRAVC